MSRYVVSAAIGGMIGYLALRLGEIGWVMGFVLLIAAALFYWVRGRRTELGWMLVGAGVVPGLFLGRNGLSAVLDPAVEVGPDTWVALLIALSVAVVGVVILLSTAGRASAESSSPR